MYGSLDDDAWSYYAGIRLRDMPYEFETYSGATKAEAKGHAKGWATAREAELRKARAAGVSPEAFTATLADLRDIYLEEASRRDGSKTLHTRLHHLDFWVEQLGGDTPIRSLTPQRIAEVRRKDLAAKGVSNATVNRYTSTLSALLQVALVDLHWIDSNPARAQRKLREADRFRWLTADEVERLLEATLKEDPKIHDFVVLLLMTGARTSELVGGARRGVLKEDVVKTRGLSWESHIDGKQQSHIVRNGTEATAVFVDTKNGRLSSRIDLSASTDLPRWPGPRTLPRTRG